MNDLDNLRRIAPAKLGAARDLAHKAVQLVTRSARANLPAAPDDSHSNLEWNGKHGAFLAQPLTGESGTIVVGFAVSRFELIVICNEQEIAAHALSGATDPDATEWLDAQLTDAGLAPMSSTVLPYDLPASVEQITAYAPRDCRGTGGPGVLVWACRENPDGHSEQTRAPSSWPKPDPLLAASFRHRNVHWPRSR